MSKIPKIKFKNEDIKNYDNDIINIQEGIKEFQNDLFTCKGEIVEIKNYCSKELEEIKIQSFNKITIMDIINEEIRSKFLLFREELNQNFFQINKYINAKESALMMDANLNLILNSNSNSNSNFNITEKEGIIYNLNQVHDAINKSKITNEINLEYIVKAIINETNNLKPKKIKIKIPKSLKDTLMENKVEEIFNKKISEFKKTELDIFNEKIEEISNKFESGIVSLNMISKKMEVQSNWNSEEKRERIKFKTDMSIQFNKIKKLINNYEYMTKDHFETIEYHKRIIPGILNDIEMQYISDIQNEIDKNSISLIGVKDASLVMNSIEENKPIISLNKQCVNCSHNPTIIITAFKMACLKYTASHIKWKDSKYNRIEFLKLRHNLIENLINPIPISHLTNDRNIKSNDLEKNNDYQYSTYQDLNSSFEDLTANPRLSYSLSEIFDPKSGTKYDNSKYLKQIRRIQNAKRQFKISQNGIKAQPFINKIN